VRVSLLLFLFSFVPLYGDSTLVLPFFNRSGDAQLNWIGESLAETVRESLAGHALVIQREDRLEAYRRLSIRPGAALTKASIIKVGATLDAGVAVYGNYTLETGSDPKSRGTLRITARTLDLRRLRTGPEFQESGPLEELAGLQTRLGWQTLQFLTPKTAPSEREFLAARPPVRVDAVENYIRGLLAPSAEQKHRFFTTAARLDEKFSQPRFQLGRLSFDKKEYRVAAGWLEGVTPADSRYLEANFLLGLCRYHMAAFDAAERHFRVVSRSAPLNEVWNNLGAAELRLGRPSAIESFRKALEGDDADPDYHFNLGYALWKAGRFDEAVSSFRAVLQRSPEDAEATLFLGRSLKRDPQRAGEARGEGRERLKTEYHEDVYRQLQAVLTK
jgi:tetratricopeptide (TPR) repeat protein